MDEVPSTNPYESPEGDNARLNVKSRNRTVFLVACSCVLAVAGTIAGHVFIERLGWEQRPQIFLTLGILYFAWPLLCFVVPKPYLVVVMLLPYFGIWLGLRYIGDIGDRYIFDAWPPCCAGVWSILVGGAISIYRCIPKS